MACHNPSYVDKYDMVRGPEDGRQLPAQLPAGTWKSWTSSLPGQGEEVSSPTTTSTSTPSTVSSIGKEIGLGGRINTILQAAFFKIANIIPMDEAVQYMKDAATKSYGKKGEKIVAHEPRRHRARRRATSQKVEVPESWKNAADDESEADVDRRPQRTLVEFVKNILNPCQRTAGQQPAGFHLCGRMRTAPLPQGSAAYEKRGIAVDVPEWNPQNCIQCNFCSYVCPHAVIRPVAMTDEEAGQRSRGHEVQGHDRHARHEVCYDHFHPGLHRLRFLRAGLPGHEG